MPHTLRIDLSRDRPGSLSYELSGQERLAVECEGVGTRVYANKQACAVLAQIFGKLAIGPYEPGFHLDLRTDLDDDAASASVLIIFLTGNDKQVVRPVKAK